LAEWPRSAGSLGSNPKNDMEGTGGGERDKKAVGGAGALI
jgi:hypothetical protein